LITQLAPALLHIHLHRHIPGPALGYLGVALAALISWIGLPGPGEPVLIAAGVLAAKHKLDLASVLVVAWLAATAGGVIGWAVGLKAGRALVIAPGPLRTARIRAVERGEEIFARYPVTAILVTPAFVAGINSVKSRVYQPINAISAAAWTLGLGIGAYVIGPPVLEWFDDIGTAATVGVIGVVTALVSLEVWRRYRKTRRAPS
jgi:membrane protein DedA with SNARE-associated domain